MSFKVKDRVVVVRCPNRYNDEIKVGMSGVIAKACNESCEYMVSMTDAFNKLGVDGLYYFNEDMLELYKEDSKPEPKFHVGDIVEHDNNSRLILKVYWNVRMEDYIYDMKVEYGSTYAREGDLKLIKSSIERKEEKAMANTINTAELKLTPTKELTKLQQNGIELLRKWHKVRADNILIPLRAELADFVEHTEMNGIISRYKEEIFNSINSFSTVEEYSHKIDKSDILISVKGFPNGYMSIPELQKIEELENKIMKDEQLRKLDGTADVIKLQIEMCETYEQVMNVLKSSWVLNGDGSLGV